MKKLGKLSDALILVGLILLIIELVDCTKIGGSNSNDIVKISIGEWIGWQSLLDANDDFSTTYQE